MHQTRQEITPKLPIPRKGTKYVARAFNHHRNAVPILIAVRDMLKQAKTAREVREMMKQKLLKINGRVVMDHRQSIRLFNIVETDKPYRLTLLPTGKFAFEPTEKETRLCKVMNKTMAAKGIFQLHLHDGTTLLTKEKIEIGDSLMLDVDGKIKKQVSLASAKKLLIIAGTYLGMPATLQKVVGSKVLVKLKDKETLIDKRSVIAL